MKQLSIITVNRNNALGLEQTILSVVNQTWKNYEYIVIDGASTDNSVEIINRYANIIKYWVSEPDTGIYHAMNKGIKQATGNYCLFLNSGDYLYNIDVLNKVFSNYLSEDIIYANLAFKNNEGTRIQTFPEEMTFYWLYTEFLGHASTFIKRKLFSTIDYYNETNKIVSDWEFFLLAICKHQCTTRYLNFPLAVLIEGGISNNPKYHDFVKQERRSVLENHFALFIHDYELLYDLRYNTYLKKAKRLINKVLMRK